MRRRFADPVTRRDLLWLVVNGCAGGILVAPASLAVLGVVGFIGPTIGPPIALPPPAFPGNRPTNLIAIGVVFVGLGLWVSPRLLSAYGVLARLVLAGDHTDLTQRVDHLTRTRAESIDTAAAEMRRIERDLHDGAQARLIAMGMALEVAAHAVDSDPPAARAQLDEARDALARALAELRDLIRGIHPPLLADRGLAEAIRALTLDSAVPAHLTGHLPGQAPTAVESAAYYATSELLANTARHAQANTIRIDIQHTGGTLRIAVTDDGRGGADPSLGTGLRGIQRRIAAFDGTLTISSPPGGPTTVTMEIPCALSWPKTSSSSATA
jgi:signal transduction histidine kinase